MLHQIAQAVLGAKAPAARSETMAAALAAPPSNQQIVDAAKKAYTLCQSAADASALALVNLVNTGSQRAAIAKLDGVNWASPGIDPKLADPIFASQDVQGAAAAAREIHDLHSLSVGVFTNNLPGGGVGMVGFARDLAGATTQGVKLTLDLFKNVASADTGSNLQLGVWQGAAGSLHDKIVGLYIATSLRDLDINLKIILSTTLEPYGFVVSAGASVNLPVSTAVFAGSTATWP